MSEPPSAYFASKSYQSLCGQDLAHRRGDRRVVAEHAALHLAAADEPLDEDLVVVPERERDRGRQLLGRPRPSRCRRSSRAARASRIPAARARRRSARAAPGRRRRRDARAASATAPSAIPASRSTALQTALSIASAEPSTPAPTYGTSSISHSPCTVPSSPNGPCRIGSTTSTSSGEAATSSVPSWRAAGTIGLDAPGSSAAAPAAGSSHRPSRPISIGTTSNRAGSSAATTEAAEAREMSCSDERPPDRTATRTRRCVTAPSRPTVIVTVEPFATFSPGRRIGRLDDAVLRRVGHRRRPATATLKPWSWSALRGVGLGLAGDVGHGHRRRAGRDRRSSPASPCPPACWRRASAR